MAFSCCTSLSSFCFWGNNSTFHCVKKNQLDAQLILFRQPLHVASISRPIVRWYNHMFTTVDTYYSF
jgi:hypothetical protein